MLTRTGIILTVLSLCCTIIIAGQDSWHAGRTIRPEELAAALSRPDGTKPVVLQVGIEVLYRNGHIPGSKFVGAGWSPEGIRKLLAETERMPRNRPIVLYCGCCPWDDCPNVRPALLALQSYGFTDVKVLYLPVNFQQDWTSKGLPTATGGA